MTETWEPGASVRKWVFDQGFPPDMYVLQLEQFRDHWIAKGETRVDWDASFRTWLRNVKNWGVKSNGKHDLAGDEAMAAWVKVAEELQHPGSAFPDGKIPRRIFRAAQAIGGMEAIDVTNGYHRRDFMVAYRELGVTS